MAKRKKKMVQLGFEPDDDLYIRQHAAKVGNTFQAFVTHAIKKEIAFLKKIEQQMAKRAEQKSQTK